MLTWIEEYSSSFGCDRPKRKRMLCGPCTELLSVVKNHSPGTWIGTKPKLFAYPTGVDVWAGSHHIEPNSFVSATSSRCYVCSTIYRDCSTELRAQAWSFRTFYELRVAKLEGAHPSMDKHYDLDFTIEILNGREPIAEQHVFECNGTFKILPRHGMVDFVPAAVLEVANLSSLRSSCFRTTPLTDSKYVYGRVRTASSTLASGLLSHSY